MRSRSLGYVLLWVGVALAGGCKDEGKLPAGSGPTSGESAARFEGRVVRVMVAASAKEAVTEIAGAFRAQTKADVKIVPGGSNTLAAQIEAEAPADVFLSANQEWADHVRAKGFAARVVPLLTNDLVLVVPKGNRAKVKGPADLAGIVAKVALAGEQVPAGKYAEQALRRAGVYEGLVGARRVARGQDVRVTLSYVERGEAEAGVVYATDAKRSARVEVVHTFDPATFDKVVYPLVLLKAGETNPAAEAFHAFLQTPAAGAVFAKHGFARVESK